MYGEFEENEQRPILNIQFKIQTTERNTDFSKVNYDPNEKVDPAILEFFKTNFTHPNWRRRKSKSV